jgi:hypothetical protein
LVEAVVAQLDVQPLLSEPAESAGQVNANRLFADEGVEAVGVSLPG